MNIGGNIGGSEISFANLLNPSDPEESGADVVLWMGPNKEPIYAHSNILRNASDYYKAAFSSRWNRSTKKRRINDKETDTEWDLSIVDTIVITSEDESSQDPVAIPSPTPTKDTTMAANVDVKFEIHHPEFHKWQMVQVLHHIYRVPTTVEIKDVLTVALIANNLLMPELEELCLDYFAQSYKNAHICAFQLYLLSSTVFSESKSSLMEFALEVMYGSFDLCMNHIYHLPSLKKRETEALIVGLPLTAKQKWILLIVWAMASTGMLDKTCENPMGYVFKDLAWKDKVNKSFKKAVKELVHFIPLVDLNQSEYIEYVRPFKDLGVLDANLKDFIIYSFEANESKVQDPILLDTIRCCQPLQCLLPNIFPLSLDIEKYIYSTVIWLLGDLLSRASHIGYDKLYENSMECTAKPLSSLPSGTITVHILCTVKGEEAAVIIDKDLKMDYMIYTLNDNLLETSQPHQSNMYSSFGGSDPKRTYIQSQQNRHQIRFPPALRDENIRDYVIYTYRLLD